MKAAKLGSEEVTHLERISYLPDDLLFRILSLIPVRNAMTTSLLSKRWKSVWKMMPTLVYDETCPNIGSLGFDQFCDTSLPLHEAPVLKNLTLKLKEYSDDIDTLLFPNIRSILLEILITSTSYPRYYSHISFPNNPQVFQTLVVLKLHGNILLDLVDSPVCFPSLKIIHLIRVMFQKEESLCRLLSACPVLEDLFFERLSQSGRSLVTLSVPSLQRLFLTKDDVCYFTDDPRFEINAPSLKCLNIKHFIGTFSFVQDMPKLVDTDVAVHNSQTEKFLSFLTKVQFLSIHLYASKVLLLADRISHSLLHLKLHVYNKIPRNLLLHLLKHSPKLQVLKLHEKHLSHTQKIKDQPRSICDPSLAPECLSFHLETFHWRGYEGTEEEKEVMVYILENARCLKTVLVSIYLKGPRGGENDLITIKELKSMSKASTSCQLFIQLSNFS